MSQRSILTSSFLDTARAGGLLISLAMKWLKRMFKEALGPEFISDNKPVSDTEISQSRGNMELTSRVPRRPWRRARRIPDGRTQCLRGPNRPLLPQSVCPRFDWLGSDRPIS